MAAIRTVANSLPKNKVILLNILISRRYISDADLQNKFEIFCIQIRKIEFLSQGGLDSIVSRPDSEAIANLFRLSRRK